ncbi:hypothetical protein [Winogradskyella pacifica]|nr:hypothetical protein [Winogradskyella pacifica]
MSFKRIYSQYQQLIEARDILFSRLMSGMIDVAGLEIGKLMQTI